MKLLVLVALLLVMLIVPVMASPVADLYENENISVYYNLSIDQAVGDAFCVAQGHTTWYQETNAWYQYYNDLVTHIDVTSYDMHYNYTVRNDRCPITGQCNTTTNTLSLYLKCSPTYALHLYQNFTWAKGLRSDALIAPIADFIIEPYSTLEQNELFDLIDNSTGTQPFNYTYWEIRNSNNAIVQTSTDLNFLNVSISAVGEYSINHFVNNTVNSSWKNVTNAVYIYDPSSLHLQYTIKDGDGFYIENANIGIYESAHGTWRYTTSPSGLGGFMDAGANHQYPLVMNGTYTLKSTKNGY